MVDPTTTHLTALVAEDEPAMLSLVARHLRSIGFRVVEASEGDVAWELARQHRPDLVILDVMMPGMSGWEICKRLKGPSADGAFAQTGVIMLTGIGENLNEMTSPLFAADAWLNKPFDFRELDARIRETLGRYAKAIPETNGVEESLHAVPYDDDEDDYADDEPESERVFEPAPAPRPVPRAAAPRPAGKTPAKKKAAKAAPAKKAATKKKPAAKKQPAAKKKPAARKAAKRAPAKKAAKKSAKKASKKRAATRR